MDTLALREVRLSGSASETAGGAGQERRPSGRSAARGCKCNAARRSPTPFPRRPRRPVAGSPKLCGCQSTSLSLSQSLSVTVSLSLSLFSTFLLFYFFHFTLFLCQQSISYHYLLFFFFFTRTPNFELSG